jgi:hypothetical protein
MLDESLSTSSSFSQPRQKSKPNKPGGAPAAMPVASASAVGLRAQTLASLVDEGTRSECTMQLLCKELHDVEGSLALAQQRLGRDKAQIVAEQSAAERVRAELRAREEEHEGLVSRLSTAQRVNDEWQERVRAVSKEFNARAAEWQAQLAAADGKWRHVVDALQQRLATSEAQSAADAQKVQSLTLEIEALRSKLRSAQASEEDTRGAATRAHTLEGTLAARTAELTETRASVTALRTEAEGLRAELTEARSALAKAQAQAQASSSNAGAAAALRSQLEEQREQLEQLEQRLYAEAEELQRDLTACQAELGEEKEARMHAEARVQADYDERELINRAWEEAMAKALREQESASASEAQLNAYRDTCRLLEKRVAEYEAMNGVGSSALLARQEAELALSKAHAESSELRERIRQMIEYHSEHQAQSDVDAQDAAVLRDEVARLSAHTAQLEASLRAEARARAAAEALLRDKAAEAAVVSTALVPAGEHEHVRRRMHEQRVRLESLQAELALSQAELERERRYGATSGGGGGFGQSLLKNLGSAVCLGTERKNCLAPATALGDTSSPEERRSGRTRSPDRRLHERPPYVRQAAPDTHTPAWVASDLWAAAEAGDDGLSPTRWGMRAPLDPPATHSSLHGLRWVGLDGTEHVDVQEEDEEDDDLHEDLYANAPRSRAAPSRARSRPQLEAALASPRPGGRSSHARGGGFVGPSRDASPRARAGRARGGNGRIEKVPSRGSLKVAPATTKRGPRPSREESSWERIVIERK